VVKENMTGRKKRYICVKVDGLDVYIESISAAGTMRKYLPVAKLRLREIEKVMPCGKWAMKIEQQWPEKGATHYQWINVRSGKLEEQVLS